MGFEVVGEDRPRFAGGVGAAVPVAVGYLPAGVAFGIAAREAGLGPGETVLMSLVVYSGASQFALVGLLASGASWVITLLVPLVLSLRHLLYGPALAPRLRNIGRWRAAVAAFGLNDEVFALATTNIPPAGRFGWLLGLELGAYAAWAGATLAGGVAGAALTGAVPSLAPALSFALPALFVALLVSMVRVSNREAAAGGKAGAGSVSKATLAAIAAAGAVAAASQLAGLGNWGVVAAGVAGPAFALLLRRIGVLDGS